MNEAEINRWVTAITNKGSLTHGKFEAEVIKIASAFKTIDGNIKNLFIAIEGLAKNAEYTALRPEQQLTRLDDLSTLVSTIASNDLIFSMYFDQLATKFNAQANDTLKAAIDIAKESLKNCATEANPGTRVPAKHKQGGEKTKVSLLEKLKKLIAKIDGISCSTDTKNATGIAKAKALKAKDKENPSVSSSKSSKNLGR
jgi:hypothetical protein